MFSNVASTLAFSLGLASMASAAAAAAPQSDSGDNLWHISGFDARCANARCQYSFQITSYGDDDIPGFSASCQTTGISRNDQTWRPCTVTYGSSDGVQSVKVYLPLTPLRPNSPSQFRIRAAFSDSDRVTYYTASLNGSYNGWRDTSRRGSDAGKFDMYPAASAAVA